MAINERWFELDSLKLPKSDELSFIQWFRILKLSLVLVKGVMKLLCVGRKCLAGKEQLERLQCLGSK